MSKILRIVIITLLVAVFALSITVFCYADDVPYYSDYTPCDIYVNGNALSQQATLVSGNIYIDIDTLRNYGVTDGWMFDEDLEDIWIKVKDQDVFFGDEETTEFIKRNAGTIAVKLKYFNTWYDYDYKYYVSLGAIADLARLEWTYKDGAVYIVPYKDFASPFLLATGVEDVYTTASGAEQAPSLRENQLLRIVDRNGERIRVSDTAGDTYFIPKDQAYIMSDPGLVHSFSRKYKEKDVYDGPINAMWSDLSYCPDKIDGLDVMADVSFYPWASSDGSSYEGCVNICNYGIISTGHWHHLRLH